MKLNLYLLAIAAVLFLPFTACSSSGTADQSEVSSLPTSCTETSAEETQEEYFQRLFSFYGKARDLGLTCTLDDLRYIYALEIEQSDSYANPDEASDTIRSVLESQMVLYHYAVENNLALSEKELDQEMQASYDMVTGSDSYKTLQTVLEQNGITYGEYCQFNREYYRLEGTVNKLQNTLTKMGIENNGRYEGELVEDYSSYYVENVIWPTEEQYRQNVLEPLLNNAEQYYADHIA